MANSPFADAPSEENLPVWRDPSYLELAKSLLNYLALAIIVWLTWRLVIRPILAQRNADRQPPAKASSVPDTRQTPHNDQAHQQAQRNQDKRNYETNLNTARDLAQKDPRAVAMIVRSWMNDGNELK